MENRERSEIEELRTRLSIAEDTLSAIQNGEVDAIVVSGKVFSLSSSETPYRIIVEEMEEGAVTISAEGVILYCNQRFSEIVSVLPESITGSDFSRYIAAADRDEFRRLLLNSLKKPVRGNITSIVKGEKKYLQLSMVPLPSEMEGEVCIVVSDVTEIRIYQNYLQEMVNERTTELNKANNQLLSDVEKLREAENRLIELNATKDKFFSIIAHDLKSPFTSIIGFSELLSENLKEKDYSKIEEYADYIQKSSWRAMDLLTNLFEWSRLQTGKIEFHLEDIDICSVANEVRELLYASAWQKSIKIEFQLADGLIVTADRSMISAVLRNLISNAIKFTNPGGNITISASRNDKELIVSVRDNGTGIKPEMIDKIFRLDVSYSTPGTKGEEGTGLGLLLCFEFISRHGGKIWAESEPGKGSTFYFTLPV